MPELVKKRDVTCYCCWDFGPGEKFTCPNCGQGYGKRLPVEQRPPRPPWPGEVPA